MLVVALTAWFTHVSGVTVGAEYITSGAMAVPNKYMMTDVMMVQHKLIN